MRWPPPHPGASEFILQLQAQRTIRRPLRRTEKQRRVIGQRPFARDRKSTEYHGTDSMHLIGITTECLGARSKPAKRLDSEFQRLAVTIFNLALVVHLKRRDSHAAKVMFQNDVEIGLELAKVLLQQGAESGRWGVFLERRSIALERTLDVEHHTQIYGPLARLANLKGILPLERVEAGGHILFLAVLDGHFRKPM